MWLKSRYLFFKKLFRQPKVNASITPSSRYLAAAMVKGIDFSHVKTIVEFWPWTWVFTKEILKHAHPDTKVLCIEYEIEYVDLLHKAFWNKIVVEHWSVIDIKEILTKHDVTRPDIIISWLPFHVYTAWLMKVIHEYIKAGTVFRWFSYTPHQLRDIYQELPLEKKSFVVRNIPPAFVFGAN